MAYQLYAQSLVWPFDPFYEKEKLWGNHKSKLEAIIREIIQDRGFQPHLSPFYYTYDRLNPTKVGVYRGGKDKWTIMRSQDLAATIGDVYMQDMNRNPPHLVHNVNAGGTDTLYCFTGLTGKRELADSDRGFPSLMGFVLHRMPTNTVHIVFRGTQGGDAVKEKILTTTHPDWATNYAVGTENEQLVCNDAAARTRKGMTYSLKSILPNVTAILNRIATNNQAPPSAIYASGHSLGGALATLFSAAVNLGTYRTQLTAANPALANWDWPALKLITFSAPPACNQLVIQQMNSFLNIRRVWIDNDAVVIADKKRGDWGDLEHPGTRIMLPHNGMGRGDRHSLPNVRRGLLEFLKKTSRTLPRQVNATIPGLRAGAIGTTITDPNFTAFWLKELTVTDVRNQLVALAPANQLVATAEEYKRDTTSYLNIIALLVNRNSSEKAFEDKGELIVKFMESMHEGGDLNAFIKENSSKLKSPLKEVFGNCAEWSNIIA